MRLVFFALLFVNLTYFAWARWVDAPKPPPVNETMAHLPRLKLVDELPPAERPQAHAAQKTSMSSTAACLSVGPFGDPAAGAQAAAFLKTKGFEPRQRTEPGEAAQSYWVYVAVPSQPEADGALAALERNGIGDARLMPESGVSARRISLGMYSERVRAERRAEAVRQAGLKAEIATRRLPATLYWIDLTAPEGAGSVPTDELHPSGANSRLLVQPCPASVPVSAGAGASATG